MNSIECTLHNLIVSLHWIMINIMLTDTISIWYQNHGSIQCLKWRHLDIICWASNNRIFYLCICCVVCQQNCYYWFKWKCAFSMNFFSTDEFNAIWINNAISTELVCSDYRLQFEIDTYYRIRMNFDKSFFICSITV